MRKRGWMIAGAVATILLLVAGWLVAGWLYFFSGLYGAGDNGMYIQRVEPEEAQAEGSFLYHLNPADVDAQVPFFAKALRDAAREGYSSIGEWSEYDATCAYLFRITDNRGCSGFFEFEGTYFDVGFLHSGVM